MLLKRWPVLFECGVWPCRSASCPWGFVRRDAVLGELHTLSLLVPVYQGLTRTIKAGHQRAESPQKGNSKDSGQLKYWDVQANIETFSSNIETFKHVWFLSLALNLTGLKGGNADFCLATFGFPVGLASPLPTFIPAQVTLLSSLNVLWISMKIPDVVREGSQLKGTFTSLPAAWEDGLASRVGSVGEEGGNTWDTSVSHPMRLAHPHTSCHPPITAGRPCACPCITRGAGTMKPDIGA